LIQARKPPQKPGRPQGRGTARLGRITADAEKEAWLPEELGDSEYDPPDVERNERRYSQSSLIGWNELTNAAATSRRIQSASSCRVNASRSASAPFVVPQAGHTLSKSIFSDIETITVTGRL
jgi:hypothetical protein